MVASNVSWRHLRHGDNSESPYPTATKFAAAKYVLRNVIPGFLPLLP